MRGRVELVRPREPNSSSSHFLFKRIPELAKELWATSRRLCLSILAARLTGSALPVLTLGIAGLLIDAINRAQRGQASPQKVWALLLAEAMLVLASDGLNRFGSHCDLVLNGKFSLRTNLRLMAHCSQLDLESFEDPLFQDRLERARSQANSQVALLRTILQIAEQSIGITTMVVGAFVLAPSLILIQLIGVIPIVLAESYFAKRRYHLSRQRTSVRRMLDYLLLLGTSSATIKEVKLFGLHPILRERYGDKSEKYNAEDENLSAWQSTIGSLLVACSTAIYYGAYCVLIYRTVNGLLTIGRLVFLAGVLQRSKSQLSSLFSSFTRTSDQILYLNDIFDFFDQKPVMKTVPKPVRVPSPLKQGIEFRNVSFSYRDSEDRVLSDLSFRILPGERIALVGANGAGKTTVIKLLTRLYDPTEGQILLDGIDLREFDPNELRAQISGVLQDFVRYDLPVAENIGFGDVHHREDMVRIVEAAERSQADSLIDTLPGGYQQLLGRRFDGGVDLSGGQWQKIAWARTCMREAQVVILDEPTSAIDARAEHQLFRNFSEMVQGKTAILISHRFSTVRIADRILVLERGRLQEQGSHDELLHKGGEYAQLFELQAAGFR